MKIRNLTIAGTALFVAAIVAMSIGQTTIWAEMDAVDSAGPGGPSGTVFGPGGLTMMAGVVLCVVAVALLCVALAKHLRRT